jgi:hypothetical protein
MPTPSSRASATPSLTVTDPAGDARMAADPNGENRSGYHSNRSSGSAALLHDSFEEPKPDIHKEYMAMLNEGRERYLAIKAEKEGQ